MNPNGSHPKIAWAGIQPFRLKLLGGLSLARENCVVEAKRSGLALLAVLASSGSNQISRDKLIGLLWPDTDEDHARASLKQTIYLLRRELDREDLILGSTELRLNLEAVAIDRADFEGAISRRSWSEAIDLYGGAFLDGVYLRSAPDFNRWVDAERAQLAESFAHAMEQNARDLEANGDYKAASRRWRSLLAEAP